MSELITLDEYYNRIGRETYPKNWSKNTIKCLLDKENKEKYKHLLSRAKKVKEIAQSRIWEDGSIKVCYGTRQGYVDPNFGIYGFDFPLSVCYNYDHFDFKCKLKLKKKDNRGAPNKYREILIPLIEESVKNLFLSKKIPTEEISALAVIEYVKDALKKRKISKIPSDNTIRGYLHELYDECKKTTRNSKK